MGEDKRDECKARRMGLVGEIWRRERGKCGDAFPNPEPGNVRVDREKMLEIGKNYVVTVIVASQ